MLAAAYALFAINFFFAAFATVVRSRYADIALYTIAGIAMIMFCALRPVGADQDSLAYYAYFNLDAYSLSLVAEPSFIFLADLARATSRTEGLTTLFFFYAVIGVSIKFIAFRSLTDLYWFALIVYFSNYFLLHEFTQIRAGVASGLVLISIRYIYERAAMKFIICISLASLFHYSSLIIFPMYLISNPKLTKIDTTLLSLAVPAGIVFTYLSLDFTYVIPIELIRTKIDIYIQAEALRDLKLNPFNAVYLIKYAILYVLILCRHRLSELSPYFPILIKFYAVSLFFYLALSFNSAFAIRISELFGIVEIILVPLLCYFYRDKLIAFVGVLVYASASLALSLYQTELIQEV